MPAGVDSGSRLRVRGEGNAGLRGGPPGDLYVFIEVRADPELQRQGNDILLPLKVSYLEAILGTKRRVRTVDGDVDLRVPAGTQVRGGEAGWCRTIGARGREGWREGGWEREGGREGK